jgi:molybdenum cofactor cytidylyltransferase
MGGPKHLLQLDGVPLAERVLTALRGTSAARVALVIRPDDAPGRAFAERLGVTAVLAEGADEGRAASMRAALRATSPRAAGVLFALADQPFLASADFEAIFTAFRAEPHGIVRASYDGAPSTPVLFARSYFPELLELRGREGGRAVIARHPKETRAVPLPAARGRDLDRPEDFAGA